MFVWIVESTGCRGWPSCETVVGKGISTTDRFIGSNASVTCGVVVLRVVETLVAILPIGKLVV